MRDPDAIDADPPHRVALRIQDGKTHPLLEQPLLGTKIRMGEPGRNIGMARHEQVIEALDDVPSPQAAIEALRNIAMIGHSESLAQTIKKLDFDETLTRHPRLASVRAKPPVTPPDRRPRRTIGV